MQRIDTRTDFRAAQPHDAETITEIQNAAWRHAYAGIIPTPTLERFLSRRSPQYWRRKRVSVLDVKEKIVAYSSFGFIRGGPRTRTGEIREFYLLPEYQGLGFGRQMFQVVEDLLTYGGMKHLHVWSLTANTLGCGFYEHMGGRITARTTQPFAGIPLARVRFTWG